MQLLFAFQFIVTLAVLLSAALAVGQIFGDYRSFGYRSLHPDFDFNGAPAVGFGGPADFSGSAVVRDSRQDRGTGNYNFRRCPPHLDWSVSSAVGDSPPRGHPPLATHLVE